MEKHLPTMKRLVSLSVSNDNPEKRKHDIAEKAEELPLHVFAFDLIYLDGEDLTRSRILKEGDCLKKLSKETESHH